MSEPFFDEIQRYVGFDAVDQRRLHAFHPIAQPRFAAIAERFYDRIREHEAARRVFQSEAQVQRLMVSLQIWMNRVLLGPWDRDYFEAGSRIGRMHVKVKLPQRYMFTAMSVIRTRFLGIIHEAFTGDDEAATAAAVCRVLDLELAIMLETYREDYVAAIRRFERLDKDVLQHRLDVSEARYRALVEDTGMIVIGVDTQHSVQIFNRGAEEVTGFTRAEIVGRDCREILCHPGDENQVSESVRDTLSGIRTPPFEARLLDHRGQERWIRWHPTRLAAAEDPTACLIGMDITEDRALALRTRRTEHLASLGTLAAGLAHEIRNPLNAAQLQLMLAERRVKRGGDAEIARALEAAHLVREELQRLGGLVEDFLAFARPNELRLVTIDLRDVIAGVIELVTPDADAIDVSLAVAAPHPVIARVDQERFKQVLLNLIRNAIEAAGAGGEVCVVARRGAVTADIQISDTGPGIPAGIDIFEPFATTKDGGTGLGLPIVHRILIDHGGDIEYRREDGRTAFHLSLPLDGPGV